jgi:hypothetical protein
MPSVQGDSDAILCSSSCWPLLALGELNNLRALSDYLVVLSTSAGRFWLSTSQCGILPATSFPLSEYDRINFLQYLLCSAPAILAERIHALIPQTRTIYWRLRRSVCVCLLIYCVCIYMRITDYCGLDSSNSVTVELRCRHPSLRQRAMVQTRMDADDPSWP